ncbi:hypothetical protein JXB28_05280 [Candidatus Woesearchaeota archaeon]|nr:hypothetical protein [Candidatus Woesearchaeota archaeon]
MGVGKIGKSALVLLFYAFFSIILSALFVIVVTGKVRDAVEDAGYYKKFYSRDMALLVDSLHAASGDFEINYEVATPEKINLDARLELDRVVLTEHSDQPPEQRSRTEFLFGYNAYTRIIPADVGSSPFAFNIIFENHNITFAPKPVPEETPS